MTYVWSFTKAYKMVISPIKRLWEAIIDKWHKWFDSLKQELNVHPESAFCCS
jgi:hypothetical protein